MTVAGAAAGQELLPEPGAGVGTMTWTSVHVEVISVVVVDMLNQVL